MSGKMFVAKISSVLVFVTAWLLITNAKSAERLDMTDDIELIKDALRRLGGLCDDPPQTKEKQAFQRILDIEITLREENARLREALWKIQKKLISNPSRVDAIRCNGKGGHILAEAFDLAEQALSETEEK